MEGGHAQGDGMPPSGREVDSLSTQPDERAGAYAAMVERITAAAGILAPSGAILAVNRSLAALLNTRPEKVLGVPLDRFVALRHRAALARLLDLTAGGRRGVGEVALLPDGPEPRYLRLLLCKLHAAGQEVVFLVAVDLSRFLSESTRLRHQNEDLEARVAERTAELQAALADKDMLLQEVHHRTKNNLQMLCDLLYLQMEGLEDDNPKHMLQDTYARIYAIAKLHEQLYQSLDGGRVSVGKYLERLVEGAQALYEGLPMRVEVSGGEPELDTDRAIHLGLMVNELLTNAAKHAFPAGAPGEAGIRVRAVEGRLELEVWDTGRGLPPAIDLETASSLGLRIVRILSRRLRAVVTLESGRGGTRVTIVLPLSAEAEMPAPGTP
jgi:two-component sensor histidine kinase